MTDPSHPDDASHWRKLAEEFGLEPEPTAPSPKAVPARSAEPEALAAAAERVAPPSSVERLGPSAPHSRRAISEQAKAGPDPAPANPAPAEISVESPVAEEEGAPARGRRRGRRGPRRAAEPESESVAETPESGEPLESAAKEGAETSEEDKPKRRRRGRGRGRDRRGKEDEVEREETPEEEPVAEEEEEPFAVEEEDDEDATDYSDWSVPSWQDLIASLYRPDR